MPSAHPYWGMAGLSKKIFDNPSQLWVDGDSKDSGRSPFFKCKSLLFDDSFRASSVDEVSSKQGCKGLKHARTEVQSCVVKSKGVQNIVRLLKACTNEKDLCKGFKLHGYIQDHKLDSDCYVSCSLIAMYGRCGALAKAQQVLNELPASVRHVITWNALIAGYVQQNQGGKALKCFDDMQHEGHSPNAVTFTCALKACGSIQLVAKGEQIHDRIVSLGLLNEDIVLGNALVDMYARCGALAKARKVLCELPVQNVVAWTALIAGYAQHGQSEEALKCFESMLHNGLSPNAITFTCVLKACGSTGAAYKGEQIHEELVCLGMLEKDVLLGCALVDMYARCGALLKAQRVFDELPVRNVVTWNALIAGYSQHGQGEEALKCFDSMQQEGFTPNVVTFSSALQACGSVRAVVRGAEIHDKLVGLGLLQEDVLLGSMLVDMYAKCGALIKAHQVLDELHVRNVVAWTAITAGYVLQGQGEEALECFDGLQYEGYSPNTVTFTCALKACGIIGAVTKGEQIHDRLITLGILEKDVVLGSALMDMYVKCGALEMAQQVLYELPMWNVALWNTLIVGYTQQGRSEEALKCFDSMQCEDLSPNEVTFTCLLKACGSVGALARGIQFHEKIVSLGMLETNIVLGSALVDMYAMCGALMQAQKVLDELPVRDIMTWSALVTGYAKQGQSEEALKSFCTMQHEGLSPNIVSFACALKACGSIGAINEGEQIHIRLVNLGILDENTELGNSLVGMYARCGMIEKAQLVLDELPLRSLVAWTSLVAGYSEQGQSVEALKCFDCMQHEGHPIDAISFTCALKACGSAGAVTKGKQIHDKIVSLGMLEKDIVIGSALVDMYAKCSALAEAQQVFDWLPVHDVVAWTALIAGYAQQGQGEQALSCFDRMQFNGVKPGSATIVCVLNACSHSGLLVQAGTYFSRMSIKYGITPDAEHYCCMVDVFSRAGKLDKVLIEIAKLLSAHYLPFWLALLGACWKWGNLGIGRLAFECVLCSDITVTAAYICMANIYSAAEMQEDADSIEALRVANVGMEAMFVD